MVVSRMVAAQTDLELSPRIENLRKQALAFANEPDPTERGWAVMRSHDETRAEPMILRRAKAVAAYLQAETLTLDDGDLLAGRVRRGIAAHPGIHEGYQWVNVAAYPEFYQNLNVLKESPVSREFIAFMRAWIRRHPSVYAQVSALRPDETQIAMTAGAFTANGVDLVHRLPRFQRILERGAEGLRAEALARMQQLDATWAEDAQKRLFYQSLILVYEAMIAYGERWAETLAGLARAETDAARRRELEQMASICRRVPAQPARSFWEAVQSVWLTLCVNQAEAPGSAISFGRLDQYLYPYFKADVEAGRITREQAPERIECLFLKCYRTFDFHNTTLGGLTPAGEDATNDLSYLCLEAVERLRTPRDICVRIHPNTPPAFFERAVRVARLGLGRPDFWNDTVMIDALVKAGIHLEDARDYAPIGCVEITIPGKCNSRTMGHAINLLKALQVALNGGRCALTGRLIGLPETTAFPTYESLHAAYRRQAARFIRMAIEEDVRGFIVQREAAHLPVLSALTVGCLESGRDVTAGGAVYHPAGVNLFGVANVADSLAAIRKCVYQDRAISLDGLRQALWENFEGREDLRRRLLTRAPKYGNDHPAVDELAAAEVAFYCDEIAKYRTPEGDRYLPLLFGCNPASVYHLGPKVGASADGRRSGEPLATSVNPTHGRERSGITAELNSVAHTDFTRAAGGASFIVDLHPTAVEGEEGLAKLVNLLRTFFQQGGLEIGLNVLREEQLREAQAHPTDYGHVMVRVFGFSTQFVSLSPELQEHVIERIKHRD